MESNKTRQRALRVYADTSVYGGMFDVEFARATKEFFAQVRRGRFRIVTSAVVQAEVESAPLNVQVFFKRMLARTEIVDVTEKALSL